jgi:outer membrane protein assembly factor BamB
MTTVDQIKGRRGATRLRAHDPALAYPGYTLFTPSNGGDTVYLIDMTGEVVHTWRMPYPPGLSGCLTDRGTLLYNGKVLEEPRRFLSAQPWKAGVILEVGWDGRVLWEVRHPDHHHDGILLRNGNVLLLCIARLPDDIAARVQGGQPGSEHEGAIYGDYLVEMARDGAVVWEWRSWEHLDPEVDRITAVQDLRHEWTHGNAVIELPDGNLIASFRNISTLVEIDRTSGDIVWKLGAPPLAQQHAPALLENGNLLIFDNGTHRLDHPVPHSRVIEVDRATQEVVWSYQEHYPFDFFSPYISNAQRLPNGNTLICEGSFGRLFEVTPAYEVVWEYVNPYFVANPQQPDAPPANRVFRAYRYSADEIERARGNPNWL